MKAGRAIRQADGRCVEPRREFHKDNACTRQGDGVNGVSAFKSGFSILTGVRINLSKAGVLHNWGPRGADVNIGKDGSHHQRRIPGTGFRSPEKSGGLKGGVGILGGVVGGLGLGLQARRQVEKILIAGAHAGG